MSSVKCTARGHPSALKAQRRAFFARDSSERTPNSSHMQSIDHEGMQGPGDSGADIYPSPQDLPMALSLGSEYKRSTTTACSEEVRIDHDPVRSISRSALLRTPSPRVTETLTGSRELNSSRWQGQGYCRCVGGDRGRCSPRYGQLGCLCEDVLF